MPALAAYIKHPDRISLIHHKTTGEMMNDILRSAARTQGNARGSIPVLTRFVQAYAGWQQCKRLATLDDAALRDMGLTRAQAEAEAVRPLWNAPDQWLR